MGNISRRLARRANRDADRALSKTPAEGKLFMLAGDSLGLSAQQISDVSNTFVKHGALTEAKIAELSDAELERVASEIELADMVLARVAEMLELMRQRRTVPRELAEAADTVDVGRAEIESRQGPGFFARVAAMGRPALTAVVSAGFALLLFFWPSAAKAAAVDRLLSLENAHKIHRRNFAGLLALVRVFTDHLQRRGWIRSKKSYAISARRSPSCRVSRTGFASGRVSCRRPARPSKSSWSGGSVAFGSGVYPTPTPTSRLNVPTARSSARRTASLAKGAANASV